MKYGKQCNLIAFSIGLQASCGISVLRRLHFTEFLGITIQQGHLPDKGRVIDKHWESSAHQKGQELPSRAELCSVQIWSPSPGQYLNIWALDLSLPNRILLLGLQPGNITLRSAKCLPSTSHSNFSNVASKGDL